MDQPLKLSGRVSPLIRSIKDYFSFAFLLLFFFYLLVFAAELQAGLFLSFDTEETECM